LVAETLSVFKVNIMSDEKVQVMIPRNLYDKVKEKIEGTSITSVDEYVVLMLENEFPEESEYSAEEEELIRERLRKLGYLE
jgi:CO dehydrogenase/acetyl-CoA synthase beta subunit